jgi:hypothetical protein
MEEHRLKVFENGMVRIYGPKRERECVCVGCWRKLHNEKLCSLYASNVIKVTESRRMRWEGHVAGMKEMRNANEIEVENFEGKRSHGRPTRVREYNEKWIKEK